MATEEKKEAAIEAEVKEVTEETVDEIKDEAVETVEEAGADVEEVAEAEAEEVSADITDEVAETVEDAETEIEEAAAAEIEEAAEGAEPEVAAAPVKISSKRLKKAERREAKAARKAANKIEEKKSRPNNALIALLIFGVVIAMFAFVLGYNYFSKPATIAKYIEDNGGAESFGSMQLDAYTTANITAEGNTMNIAVTSEADDETIIEQIKEYYGGDDGKDQLEYIAAYFLTSVKPQTRAFSATAKATVTLNGEELNSVEMSYKDAKKLMEEESEHEHDDAAEEDVEEGAEDAEEAAEDAAEAAEEATETTDEAAEDAAEAAEGE